MPEFQSPTYVLDKSSKESLIRNPQDLTSILSPAEAREEGFKELRGSILENPEYDP